MSFVVLLACFGTGLCQEAVVETPPVDYGWLSVLPPLLAIAMALAFRQVIPALFVGVWLGAAILSDGGFFGIWNGLLDTVGIHVVNALSDSGHAAIVVFSLMIGGMVGIISRNGGMQGLVNWISPWANSPRRASLATGGLGLLIFFDDYANTLVVGNTMRSVTDRLRVSREKLAYLVDSTAAPVSCIAFVTTWIGTEVGLIQDGLTAVGATDLDGYAVFLASIPYSFYPILALTFVFIVAAMNRDFGPMYRAEKIARLDGVEATPGMQVGVVGDTEVMEGAITPFPDRPDRAINAVIPVVVLVIAVVGGLFATGAGEGRGIREIIGNADSYAALLWGSMLGVLVAGILSVSQRVLSLTETVDAWTRGVKAMMLAMIVLVLAWALASVTDGLNTDIFLTSLLGDSVAVGFLPAIVFILAAATAFATGTSWGTMAILMPLVIPLLWAMLGGMEADPAVFLCSIASVLGGAVWGDHCSPISDTTVLSSMASGCDHVEHVRTQLPYALTVGVVSLVFCIIPIGFGAPWWICLIVSAATLWAVLAFFGQDTAAIEVS